MKAHLDLREKHREGNHVNRADLTKHRKDVLRLLLLIPEGARVKLPAQIKEDVQQFIESVHDPVFHIEQLDLGMSLDEAIASLKQLYSL